MTRVSLVLAVVSCVALGAVSPAQAQSGGSTAVAPWVELELDAIASNRMNPPRASRALAHVSRAMYLAALAGGSARDDAVAGAASTVLLHFFPAEEARIAALADELADTGGAAFKAGRLIERLLVRCTRSP